MSTGSERPLLPSVMPLGYCDECNKVIRREAIGCPHCGESACSKRCFVHHLCRHADEGPLQAPCEDVLASEDVLERASDYLHQRPASCYLADQ
jgi:hypothetical protein